VDVYAAPALQVVPVELILDSDRIIAEIQHPGAPRRLVDYLNAVDGARIILHNAAVSGGASSSGAAQVHRDGILIAIPRGNTVFNARTLEVVPKKPVPAVVLLPGYQVSGNVHLLPDVDPANTPLIGNRHFIAMTDVSITPAAAADDGRQEPLVVVNLARTLFFAPK
jgi:hypothetical protein